MFGDLGKMASMMKNLQNLKQNMETMKAELARREYTAVSSNARVEAVVSGELVLKNIRIDPDFASCAGADQIRLAVMEAVNAALTSAKLDAASQLSSMTGGMDLPGIS